MSRGKKRHKLDKAARRRRRKEARSATNAAPQQAAPSQPQRPPEASETAQAQGERGHGSSGGQSQPSPADTTPQPLTRSQLQDIRTGLKNGADPQAIANMLGFNPLLLLSIPDIIGTMVVDKKLSARDRIAAAKTFAVFIGQRMEQEKRDQRIPERHVHTHEVSGTVTVEERREFWIHLGEILRNVPEQKEQVAALLRRHIEADRNAAPSKERT